MLVNTGREDIPGWLDLWIYVTDDALGVRRASKKNERSTKKHRAVRCCRATVEKRYMVRDFLETTRTYIRLLFMDGGAEKKSWGQYEKEQTQLHT